MMMFKICMIYHILDEDEIAEIDKLADKDIYGNEALDYGDAYEKVINDNNIDIDERVKDYHLRYTVFDLEFEDNIKDRINVIYESN